MPCIRLELREHAPPVLKVPPADHIPFGTTACESCHAASNFTTFQVSNAVPPMNHAAVTSLACHGVPRHRLSFVGARRSHAARKSHPDRHGNCSSCHATTTFTSFQMANSSPPMNHSAVAGSPCATCHAAGKSFVGAPPVVAVPANHVPIGSATCETCHSAGNFTTFSFANASALAPPSMVHSAVSSTACSTCHEAGKSSSAHRPSSRGRR